MTMSNQTQKPLSIADRKRSSMRCRTGSDLRILCPRRRHPSRRQRTGRPEGCMTPERSPKARAHAAPFPCPNRGKNRGCHLVASARVRWASRCGPHAVLSQLETSGCGTVLRGHDSRKGHIPMIAQPDVTVPPNIRRLEDGRLVLVAEITGSRRCSNAAVPRCRRSASRFSDAIIARGNSGRMRTAAPIPNGCFPIRSF